MKGWVIGKDEENNLFILVGIEFELQFLEIGMVKNMRHNLEI